MEWLTSISFWAILGAVIWLLGAILAFDALMNARTERGSVAWFISLFAQPIVAIPFYIVFGRRKFYGYRTTLNKALKQHYSLVQTAREEFAPYSIPEEKLESNLYKSLARINRWGFSRDNKFELLIDGDATFGAILEGIKRAKEYVLVEFFIVRGDDLGNRLKDALIAQAKKGVRVYFMYDEIGSYSLPRKYINELRDNEVEVEAFGTTRRSNRFQINFRNHRKIVVVDGIEAYVGGHNVGVEYLGLSEEFGHWRDTHVKILGPSVLECQAVFLMDWHWATSTVPKVNTTPKPVEGGGHSALISPMGPTQDFEICQMVYQALISNARKRVWISSPYLVPDQATRVALEYAAQRGVDVRIMIPSKKDHLIVYLAAFSYFDSLSKAGVKVLRYGPGFLHQKAVLIDDTIAGIGTVNLDNRAFFLNFEVMAFCTAPEFVQSTADMLEKDMESCDPATGADYENRSLGFRICVRIARLFSPLL